MDENIELLLYCPHFGGVVLASQIGVGLCLTRALAMAKLRRFVRRCYKYHDTKLYNPAALPPQSGRKYAGGYDIGALMAAMGNLVSVMKMKFKKKFWSVLSGLLLATALSGCVVYPSGYGYGGYGYAPVYAPVYVAPPPVYGGVFIGGGYGWGGGRRWR